MARLRIAGQRIAARRLERPADVVRWLGAVQAQDHLGALWAIGLRTRGATEADVERAIAERAIVRTWPMRGTLHLVPAEDVRWMLALLAPRVVTRRAAAYRALGLDDGAFARSRDAVARALEGGRRLGREALYGVLRDARVPTGGQRGIHVLSRLAMEGLVCHATREGKQQTFALLDEWVPAARPRAREEALAALARRYFTGHGPATPDDLAWWAGLGAREAREAVELARPELVAETAGGRALWRAAAAGRATAGSPAAHLLPPFDELLVGYRDRSATLTPAHAARVHALLSPTVVAGDRVVGTWTRTVAVDEVVVRVEPFARMGRAVAAAIAAGAARYGRFLGRKVVVREQAPAPGRGDAPSRRQDGRPPGCSRR